MKVNRFLYGGHEVLEFCEPADDKERNLLLMLQALSRSIVAYVKTDKRDGLAVLALYLQKFT